MKETTRDELKKIKEMTFGKRLQYLCDYYKIPFIGGIVAIIFIVGIVRMLMGMNINAINVYVSGISCDDTTVAASYISDEFREYLGENSGSKPPVVFDNSMAISTGTTDSDNGDVIVSQRLSAVLGSNGSNIILSSQAVALQYGPMGMYKDLSSYLPEDLFNELLEKDALIKVTLPEDTVADPVIPAMDIYAAIRLDALDQVSILTDAGYNIDETMVIGVPAAAGQYEKTLAFIQMLAGK